MKATPETHPPVLVVDDEPDLRRSLVMLLELSGIPAVGAAGGAEALAYLDGHRPPPLIDRPTRCELGQVLERAPRSPDTP